MSAAKPSDVVFMEPRPETDEERKIREAREDAQTWLKGRDPLTVRTVFERAQRETLTEAFMSYGVAEGNARGYVDVVQLDALFIEGGIPDFARIERVAQLLPKAQPATPPRVESIAELHRGYKEKHPQEEN